MTGRAEKEAWRLAPFLILTFADLKHAFFIGLPFLRLPSVSKTFKFPQIQLSVSKSIDTVRNRITFCICVEMQGFWAFTGKYQYNERGRIFCGMSGFECGRESSGLDRS